MHKVLSFSRYEPPSLETVDAKINIVEQSNRGDLEMIAEGITLKQAYNDFVKPGHILYMHDLLEKGKAHYKPTAINDDTVAQECKNYSIIKASKLAKLAVPEVTVSKAARKHAQSNELEHVGMLREVHLMLHNPSDHVKLMLGKAYRFVKASCAVEFCVRLRHSKPKKSKKDEASSGSVDLMQYLHTHFPHLRPDFILKGMPEGTRYLVQPYSDGTCVQFVLGLNLINDSMKTANLTQRLEKVKASVSKAIGEGTAVMLPREIRLARIQDGDSNYSLDTGLPKAKLSPDEAEDLLDWGRRGHKGARGGAPKVVRWGSESIGAPVRAWTKAEKAPPRKKVWSSPRETDQGAAHGTAPLRFRQVLVGNREFAVRRVTSDVYVGKERTTKMLSFRNRQSELGDGEQ